MKKKIWIFNHYATTMYKDEAGRHYWFAENLRNRGYEPTIFCASTIHNSKESIETYHKKYMSKELNHIPFVFVKTPSYVGNGKQRVKNMLTFYKNLFPVAKKYAKKYGKPDVILASSVHPLTLVAGIKIARKLGVPCVCEVRDLWPETLVEYGSLKKTSVVAKLLYKGEKWIYKKADKLIFTMEGGKDYIIEKGWDRESGGPIDIGKVHHINNGVDLKTFHSNKEKHRFKDYDLDDESIFKVVYAGSIRKVNNVKKIVDVAEITREKGYDNIVFLLFGDGPEKEELEAYCRENNITNVLFKGHVHKHKIPYILSKGNLNIMHFAQNNLKKYGASLNKMFEYFASGKPTISDCEFGYDMIKKYNCGLVVDDASPEQLADAIIQISKMPKEEYSMYCKNAKEAAHTYDFQVLTEKLETLIEEREEKEIEYENFDQHVKREISK